LLNVATTGLTNLTVSYSLRDIDGSIDNAIQPVALQFRAGSSGNFTNVPGGFVADATGGPSLATLVTPVSAALPASADNQPLVQVRVITSNAVGSDEWVGVDDISISAFGEDLAPSVLSTIPADGAVGVAPDADLSITFSEPVNATTASFAIECPTGSTALGFSLSGGPTTFTLDPDLDLPATTSCGVNVIASQVTDQDGTPDSMVEDFGFGFTTGVPVDPCADTFTPIYAIQGSGASAAITGNVTTQGVVVGDFDGPTSVGLRGCYLQDATGDGDRPPRMASSCTPAHRWRRRRGRDRPGHRCRP
jgi:hypothetical protein